MGLLDRRCWVKGGDGDIRLLLVLSSATAFSNCSYVSSKSSIIEPRLAFWDESMHCSFIYDDLQDCVIAVDCNFQPPHILCEGWIRSMLDNFCDDTAIFRSLLTSTFCQSSISTSSWSSFEILARPQWRSEGLMVLLMRILCSKQSSTDF